MGKPPENFFPIIPKVLTGCNGKIQNRKMPVDNPPAPCYDTDNFIETDDAEIKAVMLLQRVRGAGSRIEHRPSNGPQRAQGTG
jgi:hypothetical protein